MGFLDQISVAKSAVEDYLNDGWEIEKELKIKTRLRKPWSHDQRLENKVWHLFYLLGYPEISSGRTFKVTIKRKGAEPIKKQIDALAKDDETVLVAECKSSERISRRSLQKDIAEFSDLKGPIANAIKKHYGPAFKPKIKRALVWKLCRVIVLVSWDSVFRSLSCYKKNRRNHGADCSNTGLTMNNEVLPDNLKLECRGALQTRPLMGASN